MMYFFMITAILLADQISKFFVREYMSVSESINVIGEFFQLTYYQNYGAAFSSFGGQRMLLIVFPVVAVICAVVFMVRSRHQSKLEKISLALIVAGGLGNLIDRVFFVYVTDMFDFSIFPAIFNVADIAVVFGCGLLVVYILFFEKLEGKFLHEKD